MKPYYIVDFSAVNCLIDIRVNDVSVFCMNIDGQVSTIVPANNAILESGKQRVTYNILPLLGEFSLRNNTSFSASVWLYDTSGDTIVANKEITKFEMPENKTGISLPLYKGEDVFFAEVPYKLHAWQNSQDLSKIEDLKALVYSTYRKLEAIINNGQYEQFANMIQKREENIATCMYLSEEEKKGRITELVGIIQTGFKIVPVSEKDIMIVFGNDKLVALRKLDGNTALLLRNEKTEEELGLEVQFHLEQGKTELSII